jgi:ribose 5-phosphate isomerase
MPRNIGDLPHAVEHQEELEERLSGKRPAVFLDYDGTLTPIVDRPFVTDGGHYTVDCLFDAIPDPDALQTEIKRIPGVIETGLFLGIARAPVVGHADGVEVLRSHREGAL